jgi:hypothetical protein
LSVVATYITLFTKIAPATFALADGSTLTGAMRSRPVCAISRAWRLAIGEGAPVAQRDTLRAFVQKHRLENLCRVLFNLNEFVYAD